MNQETTEIGLARIKCLRDGMANELQQQERHVAALRAKLMGIDEAVAVFRECAETAEVPVTEFPHGTVQPARECGDAK